MTASLRTQPSWREAPRAKAMRLIRQWIDDGTFPAGSVLPAERQLAAKIGVGLATVQRVIQVLTLDGAINQTGNTRLIASPATDALLENVVVVLTAPQTPDRLPMNRSSGGGEVGYLRYIATGALSAIHEHGLHATALQPANMAGVQLERLLTKKPMGVVIPEIVRHAESFPELMQTLMESNVPFVAGGNHPQFKHYDHAYSDHDAGAYQLTRWLIEHGRTRILCVLPAKEFFWITARYQGYCRAMQESGLTPLPLLTDEVNDAEIDDPVVEFRVRSTYMAGRLLPHLRGDQPVQAILATNDRQAYEVRAAGVALGFESDDSLWVAGYDNFHEALRDSMKVFNVPGPVATVDKRNFMLGEELVRLLIERVTGQLPDEPQERKLEPTFIPLRP